MSQIQEELMHLYSKPTPSRYNIQSNIEHLSASTTLLQEDTSDGEFNALILSYVFWPAFKDEKIILPEAIKE